MNGNGYPDLEKLYAKCKYKVFGWYGRPRPCRNACCPCPMCRRKYSEKQSVINRRSAREKPPNLAFVLRVEDDLPLTRELMAGYLDKLVEKIKYHRKAKGLTLEYESRTHFKRGRPHLHLTVIAPADWSVPKAKALMKGWLRKSCAGREVSVYADNIRDLVGYIKYVTGDVIDRRKVERPPREWGDKKSRLVRRSNGFLARPAEVLWKEHWEELYPEPRAEPAPEVDPGEPVDF